MNEEAESVYGECLLAAMCLAYLGSLPPKKREYLMNLCLSLISDIGLKIREKFR